MSKRFFSIFLATVIFCVSCVEVYANNFSDSYNAGVSSAIVSKSSKEKIERELLRVLRLSVSDSEMEKIQADCELLLNDMSIRSVIQSDVAVDPIAALKESGKKKSFKMR